MHADHIHGINDLRSLSLISKSMIPAWGSKETNKHLKNTFLYIFENNLATNIFQAAIFFSGKKSSSFSLDIISFCCVSESKLKGGKILLYFSFSTDIKLCKPEIKL